MSGFVVHQNTKDDERKKNNGIATHHYYDGGGALWELFAPQYSQE